MKEQAVKGLFRRPDIKGKERVEPEITSPGDSKYNRVNNGDKEGK